MSSPRDDGGPAFPATEANGLNSGMSGMTIRDEFAKAAMQSILSSEDGRESFKRIAAEAYLMADALLEARK